MRRVVAALDASAAARPVMETALGIGQLMGAEVEALHVGLDRTETLEALAATNGVPLRFVRGPVGRAVLDAVAARHVVAAVVGARSTPGGRRPTGRTALRVVEQANKPTVVVPPDAVGISPRPFRRLLLPLEGSEESSRPVLEGLWPLVVDEVELVVLHVFTSATVPRVLDRPGRDLDLLGGEFLARYCPPATRIEWRTGPVSTRVGEVCGEQGADLIVLSWLQDSSAGHAAVVRDVLGSSTVPVLLLPVRAVDVPAPDPGSNRRR
jgi:nucleotide-binding universal stress UspA family protein